ncbi:MAG TPA: HAD family hydrolase [Polyangia bacterium]|jgi:histidinol-phosphate phosphatase family domain/HAD-superfamily hydrolase, subfamily IIIA|nr:HAD family hydrolase [Polyangia bacterium]
MTERAALFLDRDGVVCRALVRGGKPFPARSVAELDILPGVREALQKAGAQKLVRIIVTNQPDVARGTLARDVVEAIHERLRAELEIDDVLVCWHDDADACTCRKPKPGLLVQGAERHGVDLAKSFMVGDRWRDVEAGVRAGCRTVWIDCGYDEQSPSTAPDHTCHSLAEAVEWIGASAQR